MFIYVCIDLDPLSQHPLVNQPILDGLNTTNNLGISGIGGSNPMESRMSIIRAEPNDINPNALQKIETPNSTNSNTPQIMSKDVGRSSIWIRHRYPSFKNSSVNYHMPYPCTLS